MPFWTRSGSGGWKGKKRNEHDADQMLEPERRGSVLNNDRTTEGRGARLHALPFDACDGGADWRSAPTECGGCATGEDGSCGQRMESGGREAGENEDRLFSEGNTGTSGAVCADQREEGGQCGGGGPSLCFQGGDAAERAPGATGI